MKQSQKDSKKPVQPVLRKFQPKNFKVVTGEKLEEWEAAEFKRIGLLRLPGFGPTGVMCATISQCNGPFSPDDSDQIRHTKLV